MNYREFSNTGRKVSEIGVGCWQFGGDWGEISDADAISTLQGAVDAGVTFFDTADVYGSGRSEELIGQFLSKTKANVFVATKLGRFGTPGGDANYSKASFQGFVDASLRRLGVEALDLVQLHCIPRVQLERAELWEWLRDIKKAGKIKGFGASVECDDDALYCMQQDGMESLQIIFNIFRQKPSSTVFATAQAQKVALIVRLPLASGLLSGKYKADTSFAPQDHRTYNRDGQAFNVGETFAGLPFELGVKLADDLKPLIGDTADSTMAQKSLRWILDHPAVTTVIPGAKNSAMAKANAVASDMKPLSDSIHAQLEEFYNSKVKEHIRGPY